MKTLEQVIGTIRKKARSWLGVFVYDSALGKADRNLFAERLKAIINPMLMLKNLQGFANDNQIFDITEAGTAIKKRLLKTLTPEKYRERFTISQEILEYTPSSEKIETPGSSNTFQSLILGWARITGQELSFVRKVADRLQIYYEEWQLETGCCDFSDFAVMQHPQEYGEFLSGFSRILIDETPDKNMSKAVESFNQVIQEISEKDFHSAMQEAISPVVTLITKETGERLISTLKANPEAKNKIISPEVEALVEWEKEKQAWGGNTNRAIELLEGSLISDSKTSIDQAGRAAILNSLKVIGRRSILTNLKDAIKGQLRIRLIDCALRWLKKCLLPKPRIIWDEEEGGNEVYKILMKGCEDGKG